MEWYYVINSDMRELGLKGNELHIYAIINAYSQNGGGCYYGSLATLCEMVGITKKTAVETLKSLVDAGLIEKKETYTNGVRFCSYEVVKKLHQGCKNYTEGGVKITPNNKEDNVDISTNVSISTYRREKKNSIKRKVAEFVTMTDDEYNTLCSKYGEPFALECIEVLNSYKQSNGRRYKSDYGAINSWVVDRVTERRARAYRQAPVEKSKVEQLADEVAEAKRLTQQIYGNE